MKVSIANLKEHRFLKVFLKIINPRPSHLILKVKKVGPTLSLLEFITRGRIYPIASKGELEYLKHIKNSKFVTIKDILIISVVLWTIGGLFLENYVILEFFGSIYIKMMDLIGGGA
jgi:hypothetical protein